MKKLDNILLKYKKYVLVIAIVLFSLAVSIRSNDGEVNLILHNYPIVIFLMVLVALFLVALYIQINNKKIENLSSQIKDQSEVSSEDFDALLVELTIRQKEVYDFIILGKTNKEIMSELFIEQSTLKSHINQIYKKLNIKNRNQLKSKLKD